MNQFPDNIKKWTNFNGPKQVWSQRKLCFQKLNVCINLFQIIILNAFSYNITVTVASSKLLFLITKGKKYRQLTDSSFYFLSYLSKSISYYWFLYSNRIVNRKKITRTMANRIYLQYPVTVLSILFNFHILCLYV